MLRSSNSARQQRHQFRYECKIVLVSVIGPQRQSCKYRRVKYSIDSNVFEMSNHQEGFAE